MRRRIAASAAPALIGLTMTAAMIPTAAFAQNGSASAPAPIYQDKGTAREARVTDLFGRLTQDEKLSLLTGTGFGTRAIPRLGIPAMEMCDAGQGVRGGSGGTQGPATLFPSGITMASSWDPDLAGRIGRAIGEEVQNKGTGAQILLGPDVNIHRSPLAGRNGESFSEDPYLAARLAVGYVKGMQSRGASACIKHFACNNEEADRMFVDVKVDERTLREIYLPAFEAGVTEGGSWSLMSSYNQVNGFHSSANHYLLTDILKEQWGFDGLVMSDWGGVHETVGVVNAGNDLEMPGGSFLTHDKLAAALAAGQISQASIDDSVRRVLRTIVRVGLLDTPAKTPDNRVVNSPAHQKLTFEAASEGIVLLKNAKGVLPLRRDRIRTIAVIGPRAEEWQMGAGGSPAVTPFYSVSPLEGITKRAGSGIAVKYVAGIDLAGGSIVPAAALSPMGGGAAVHGLKAEYFANANLEGAPAVTRTDPQIRFNWNNRPPTAALPRTDFSARWTGTLTAPRTGRYTFTLVADDGCRMFLDGKQIIDHWVPSNGDPQTAAVDLTAGSRHEVRIEYYQAAGEAFIRWNWQVPAQNNLGEAVAAAKAADAAIVMVGSPSEGEGHDRANMDLPGDQDGLIRAVAAANRNTVVVLNNGTPCRMDGWLRSVPALVEAWFPGQEGGNALAAILFGDVNPSGKLPDTLGARREDYPDYGNFPGKNGTETYAEGVYVGYRHFDKAKIAPLFPFGYGLSYTTFRFANLRVSAPDADGRCIARVTLTNTGSREGAEVAQLYVRPVNPAIDRPIRELKGFRRVTLRPGETQTVEFPLDARSFAYFDAAGEQWKADAGEYVIEVGSSSRDLPLHASLHLARTVTVPVAKK